MVSFDLTAMVTLPWPDIRLNPNARVHWRELAMVKRAAKEAAAWETVLQIPEKTRRAIADAPGRIGFRVAYFPPDGRRRDDDNMVASLKAGRDGIASALGIDDRRFRAEYYFMDPQKPGRIEITLSTQDFPPIISVKPTDDVKKSGPTQRDNAGSGLTDNRLGKGGDHGS